MTNTRTVNINASSGKTYHDMRLRTNGAAARPFRTALSSKGAPTRAIPSRAVRQEESTNARAPASVAMPKGKFMVMLHSIWMHPSREPMNPMAAKAVDSIVPEPALPKNSISAIVPPRTTSIPGRYPIQRYWGKPSLRAFDTRKKVKTPMTST